jgi:hypothetical protein
MNEQFATRHVWVENAQGVKFDIGLAITKKALSAVSELSSMKSELVYQIPDGVERIDNETAEEQRELRQLEMGIQMLRERDADVYLSTATKVFQKIYKELCAVPTNE